MDFNQILLTREPPTGERSKCYNILSEAQLALRLTQSLRSKYPHSEHQIKNVRICGRFLSGGADGDRTHDLQIANLSLSQLSYSPKINSYKRRFKSWGGRWGSNSRQPVPQTGALPTELRPPRIKAFVQSLLLKVNKKIQTSKIFMILTIYWRFTG